MPGGGRSAAGCWCWWFGGRGWTVTFRTSLGNRKDKEKEGAAIVPRKRCPGQARDLPSFCCNDGGRWRNPLIHTPSYELQPGTKVRLTNRASNRDHLEHAEMSGERQDHCSSFKTYNPSRHTPYAEPAYFLPSAGARAAVRRKIGRRNTAILLRARRKKILFSAGCYSPVRHCKQLWV